MEYFVLYNFDDETHIHEVYLKGKSMKHMEERIQKYANGVLATNKWYLYCYNIKYGFLRKVDLSEFPHLTKRDFAIINENRSKDADELSCIKK